MIAYTVTCTFDDADVADEWIQWMCDEHLTDVCNAGAIEAELVRFDSKPIRVEARYHFISRQAFEEYEKQYAPQLREEGLKRFPLKRGLHYERSTGEVVALHQRAAT